MKYQWEQCPNPEVNILHVSERLQKSYGSSHDSPDFTCATCPEDDDREFIEDLWAIRGVISVSTSNYECQIMKGRLFSWSDIRPLVIERFRQRFGEMIGLDDYIRKDIEIPL